MNVVVICIDTLRWDYLGCYGNKSISTPAIDTLAKHATRFDGAYCASFPTIPMRTDAFTGNVMWPVYGWKKLSSDEMSIPEYLAEAGYWTAFIHDTSNMEHAGFARGFDEDIFITPPAGWEANKANVTFPVPRQHLRQNGAGFVIDRARTMHYRQETDWFVARTMLEASRWLEQNRKRDKFFLWVDTFEVHEDWRAPDYYTDYYSPNYSGLDYSYPNYGYTDIYQPHEIQRLRARYAAEVTLTDRWVGHLLRTMELMGLFENTMILLLSDHGMYLGEHKCMGKHTVDPDEPWPIYDEVGRIPMLLHMPGRNWPKRCPALVQPADLLPTVLEVCGLKQPQLTGKSLIPLLDGRTRKVHDFVFTSCHSWEGEGRIPYLRSCITVTSRRWTLVTGPAPWRTTLHDRTTDPAQKRNVIRDHPAVARKMHQALVQFMRRTGADEEYIEQFASL